MELYKKKHCKCTVQSNIEDNITLYKRKVSKQDHHERDGESCKFSLQISKWFSISWLLSNFLQISCFNRGELFSTPVSEIFSIAGTCPTTRSPASPRAPSPVFLICVFSRWTTTTSTVSTRKLSKVRKIFQHFFETSKIFDWKRELFLPGWPLYISM